MQQQFSDHNTDKAFRDKLSGLRVEPRSRVWYRVAAGLDRAAALRAHNRRRVIGIVIGILVITGIILTAVLDPVATRKKISNTSGNIPEGISNQLMEANADIDFLTVEKQNVSVNQFVKDFSNSSGVVAVNNISQPLIEKLNTEAELKSATVISKVKWLCATLNEKENVRAYELVEATKIFFQCSVSSTEIVECNCNDSKFYIGLNTAFNSTSLIDNAAYQNDKYISKMKFGNSVSVSAGYQLSKNLCAEVGWNIFSFEGQRYGYNVISRTTGKVEDNDYVVGLRYTQFPVMIRFGAGKYSALLRRNMHYSLAIGGMYGRLKNVSYTVSEVPFISKMRMNEIAAVGNLRAETKLTKHLSVNAGINLSFSNSLFKPDYHLSPFTQPHSFVAGIEAGVKYNFCKK